jgi:hypothetical protein
VTAIALGTQIVFGAFLLGFIDIQVVPEGQPPQRAQR